MHTPKNLKGTQSKSNKNVLNGNEWKKSIMRMPVTKDLWKLLMNTCLCIPMANMFAK